MMKICSVLLLLIVAMSCSKPASVKVDVRMENPVDGVKVAIVANDSIYALEFDSTGMASVVIVNLEKPVFAQLNSGRMRLPLYLEAGKDFSVAINGQEPNKKPEFAGVGALKNEVVIGKYFQPFRPDFTLDEEPFIKALEGVIESQNLVIDSLKLDNEFASLMKNKQKYSNLQMLGAYPSYHAWAAKLEDFKASDVYYDYLKGLIVEDETLMELPEYKKAMSSFIAGYAMKNIEEYDPLEIVKAEMDYITTNLKNPKITEYLVDSYVMSFIDREGVDNLDVVSGIYQEKVTDPKMKAAYDELCGKWAKIAKGQPSPTFKYMDINGKEVSLADLAGKYVYIDVWATWCGPCRGEIPSLKELEHKFNKNNIHFVSISCDQDKAAWEKMVKEEELGGIQLHTGGNREFMDSFMINGIPRFILLDREGKVLNANMTRPSNPKTAELFNTLEGI